MIDRPLFLPTVTFLLGVAFSACDAGESQDNQQGRARVAVAPALDPTQDQGEKKQAKEDKKMGVRLLHDPRQLKAEKQKAAGADASKGDGPLIYSEAPEVNFGDIIQGETRDHTFVIGNQGKQDLVIKSVNPTCGCTVAQVKTPAGQIINPKQIPPGQDITVLKPGETADVTAEFNSRGQPLKQLTKHIMVISSDDSQPAFKLTMSMRISSGVNFEPYPIQFGEMAPGIKKTVRTLAKLVQFPDLKIESITEKPEHMEITWEPATAPDGTPAIAFDVSVLPSAPIGYSGGTIRLKTDNQRLPELQVQYYANVLSAIVFDTGNKINKERIDFEIIPFGKAASRTVEIQNGAVDSSYVVDSIEIDSVHKDLITASLEEVKSGKHYRVTLTTDPGLDARFFRGVLKINAKSSELPLKQIPFHGWVKKS